MNELRTVLTRPAWEVAPRLLGSILEHNVEGQILSGRIVETEAYDQFDSASHSFRGQTERTRVMFGPAGYLYVYFTYGKHFCCNVVTGPAGHGAAVLIRALEPLSGEAAMAHSRQGRSGRLLTNGPGKLCQAMSINQQHNGHDLDEPPLRLLLRPPLAPAHIVQTTRIGISSAQTERWRFYIKANPYVSRV